MPQIPHCHLGPALPGHRILPRPVQWVTVRPSFLPSPPMSDERREKVRELAIVGLVSAGHFWSHFFTLAIPTALPLIRSDLGASNVSLGMVMAAFALMAAAWQFPMGVLSDRYGARVFLVGGLAIESLAMFSQSLAPAVPVMVAIALVMGIADS